jgi:hypothetical protein
MAMSVNIMFYRLQLCPVIEQAIEHIRGLAHVTGDDLRVERYPDIRQKLAAPNKSNNIRRTPPTICSLSGTSIVPISPNCGCSVLSLRAIMLISVCACPRVTPVLSRPITR